MITVLGINGSLRWPSHTHQLLETALNSAREHGARVEILDFHRYALPIFDPRQANELPLAIELRERIADAHAFILGTPVYKGGMSGAVKNLLDYLGDEASGKLFGYVVASGSETGVLALENLRNSINHFHAWSLPYGVWAAAADFDGSGRLASMTVHERLCRLGRDIAVYGRLLYEQFAHDSVENGGAEFGFAPWHANRRIA